MTFLFLKYKIIHAIKTSAKLIYKGEKAIQEMIKKIIKEKKITFEFA